MGTGWRRAFCTAIHGDPESRLPDKQQRSPSPSASPSPRSCTRLGFLSGGSNPSTPRSHQQLQHCHSQTPSLSSPNLRCQTSEPAQTNKTVSESPKLQCSTTTSTPKSTKSSKTQLSSTPSSPRSLKLSLFKNSFKFRSSCGICLNSVKTGQGTAIYTAECSHAFHFPCIADHVCKHGTLVCPVPVCNATWKDVPLLAIHKNLSSIDKTIMDVVSDKHSKITIVTAQPYQKKIPADNVNSPSPRALGIVKHGEDPSKHSGSLRCYDDDEPLLSPTSGGDIIPIPEADENTDEDRNDDVEEFQGFFVNHPTSSSSSSAQFKLRDSRNVLVKLMPECALVSACRTHETYALALRIKAPPTPSPQAVAHPSSSSRSCNGASTPLLDPSHRATIDLVTVLDVSGGMTGVKLHMLKRAVRLVISSLGPADRLSIVAFSSSTKRLLHLKRMTPQGQSSARRIVDRLVCGQGASVAEALRKAIKVLEDRRDKNPVACVMLLSDGQDGRGSQRQSHTHTLSSTRFAHIEIPVHSFGYGYSHEPAEDAFAKRVGGLLSVVVQDLSIQLGFSTDSAPAEICAVYACNGHPTVLTTGALRLGDLYAEEERELLIELRVPASCLSSGAQHELTVRCLYKDPVSQEMVYGREQPLIVPPLLSFRSTGPRIERLRSLFITTRAMAESRRLIEHNDLTSANQLLASARALLLRSSSNSNSKFVNEYVSGLECELAELQWRRQQKGQVHRDQQLMGMIQRRRTCEKELTAATVSLADENGEPLTPTSAWRAAEKLAKVAIMKKSLNKFSDLHGFENARF